MSAKTEMETDNGKEEAAVQTNSQHERNQDEEEQESETSCGDSKYFHPLFMDGLPSDFASNPQLAAIASLMDDGDYKEECEADIKTMPKEGGGKVRRQHRKHSKKSNPYIKPEKKKNKNRQTSLGEAQLFLNMWKL